MKRLLKTFSALLCLALLPIAGCAPAPDGVSSSSSGEPMPEFSKSLSAYREGVKPGDGYYFGVVDGDSRYASLAFSFAYNADTSKYDLVPESDSSPIVSYCAIEGGSLDISLADGWRVESVSYSLSYGDGGSTGNIFVPKVRGFISKDGIDSLYLFNYDTQTEDITNIQVCINAYISGNFEWEKKAEIPVTDGGFSYDFEQYSDYVPSIEDFSLSFYLLYDKEKDGYIFATDHDLDGIKSYTLTKNSLTVVMNKGYNVEHDYRYATILALYTETKSHGAENSPDPAFYNSLGIKKLKRNVDGDYYVTFQFDRDYAPGEILQLHMDTQMND